METWTMGAGLRPVGKPPDQPPDPNVVARHSSTPTALCSVFSWGCFGLSLSLPGSSTGQSQCLVRHEFSSLVRIIISSLEAMAAGGCFTTRDTTIAWPEGLENEVQRSGWVVLAFC